MKSLPRLQLLRENTELRARLDDAEETLRAIRSGEVDALVIQSAAGPQVYTLQGQDAEASRIRGEMLAQVGEAVIAFDGEGRTTFYNAGAEKLYGLAAPRVLGQVSSAIYTPRWLHPEDEDAAMTAMRECSEWRGENVHITHDGREINVEAGVTVLPDRAGKTAGMLTVIRDITTRKQADEKLRISETRYRRLFEAAQDGVLIIDPATRKILDANPFMSRLLGYSHDELVGKELYQIGLLKDENASQEMVRTLKRTGQVRYDDLPLENQSGKHQEVEVVANQYDEGGRSVIQCNIRDITERKRSEELVIVLMAEVNHRAKNLLAVVQAVAYQTLKHGDATTIVARLSDRIGALAAGQDLLVKNNWRGVDMSELVRAQLAHFKDLIDTRILLEGPPAELRANTTQGIGMALHELATNASKYGALSNGEGRVHINWERTKELEPRFLLSWTEVGGPQVIAPTRTGFGHIIIGRMAENTVCGTTDLVYAATGVRWHLSAPMTSVLM